MGVNPGERYRTPGRAERAVKTAKATQPIAGGLLAVTATALAFGPLPVAGVVAALVAGYLIRAGR